MRNFRLIRAALWVTIVIFAVAAAYISAIIFRQQSALREVSRYNVAWSTGQATGELLRFEMALLDFVHGAPEADRDELELRFDILRNRLTLFHDGSVAEFIGADPERCQVLADFAAAVDRATPLVPRVGEPGVAAQIRVLFRPLESRLVGVASAANRVGGELVAHDQELLVRYHWIFSLFTFGVLACGVLLVVGLLVNHRLLAAAHARLTETTASLEAAKRAAEAASEAKSRFIGNMSHELRTPLNAIIGFGELIAGELMGPVGNQQYVGYARDILAGGRRMTQLVEDILTVVRLESDEVRLAPEPCDPREIVAAQVAAMRRAEADAGHRFELVGRDWPPVEADPRALAQMLAHLLSNATKFSPAGSTVAIGVAPAGAMVHLFVRDAGIGIVAEALAGLAAPFHQLDTRLERRYEGAGLGLYIVRTLAERQGGRLVIESEPGRGTTAILVLPAAELSLAPPVAA